MKHHGYLFTAEMVLAILARKKTETRRIVTSANSLVDGTGKGIRDKWERLDWSKAIEGDGELQVPYKDRPLGRMYIATVTPRVHPGDLAYVKETWRPVADCEGAIQIAYKAGGSRWVNPDGPRSLSPEIAGAAIADSVWRSPLHLPKIASRAWLPIESVGAGFLRDITEAEAKAEGTRDYPTEDEDPLEEHDWSLCPKCGGTLLYNDCGPCFGVRFDNDCYECDTYVKRFKHLWTSIHGDEGPKSWDANPPLWIPRWREVRRSA